MPLPRPKLFRKKRTPKRCPSFLERICTNIFNLFTVFTCFKSNETPKRRRFVPPVSQETCSTRRRVHKPNEVNNNNTQSSNTQSVNKNSRKKFGSLKRNSDYLISGGKQTDEKNADKQMPNQELSLGDKKKCPCGEASPVALCNSCSNAYCEMCQPQKPLTGDTPPTSSVGLADDATRSSSQAGYTSEGGECKCSVCLID